MLRFFDYSKERDAMVEVEASGLYRDYKALVDSYDVKNTLFGLCVPQSTRLAVLIDVIRRSGNAFCWLDVNSDVRVLQTRANRFRPCVYISVRELPWLDGWREAAGLHVTRAGDVGSLDSIDPDIAYVITTSGSSGEPKVVHVPNSCIMANVYDFIERFGIDANSRHLWAEPACFDISMLEVLVALDAGGEVYTLEAYRSAGICVVQRQTLLVRPTWLQAVPSVLAQWSADSLRKLFGPDSGIAVITLGGEPFHVSLVKKYAKNCAAKVYNLYGSTCTLFDPAKDDVADVSNEIRGAQVLWRDDGIVELRGRSTYVDGVWQEAIVTGDRYALVDDHGVMKRKLLGRNQLDCMFGAPREVESYVVEHHKTARAARLVVAESNNSRYLFVQRDETATPIDVPKEYAVKRIIDVERLPLGPTGKCDDVALRKLLDQILAGEERGPSGAVATYLRAHPQLRAERPTIASLGFSSNDRFEFLLECATKWEEETRYELHHILFDDKTTTDQLFDALERRESAPKHSEQAEDAVAK